MVAAVNFQAWMVSRKRTQISTGAQDGQPIGNGAINRGDVALAACCHRNAAALAALTALTADALAKQAVTRNPRGDGAARGR